MWWYILYYEIQERTNLEKEINGINMEVSEGVRIRRGRKHKTQQQHRRRRYQEE